MPEDIRIQLAGHVLGYIGIIGHARWNDSDINIFNLYIQNTPEDLWRLGLKISMRLKMNSIFYKLMRRHAAKWLARDISDDLR